MCLDCTKSGLRHSQVNRQPPTESSKRQTPTHDCCVDRSWLSFFARVLCVYVCVRVFGWAAALHATLAFWHIIPLVPPPLHPPPPSLAWLKAVCFAVDFRYVLVCRLVVLAAPESVLQHFLPFTFLHSQWKEDVCV